MKLLGLVLALSLHLSAHADFSGEWRGDGRADDGNGWNKYCRIARFALEQTPTSIKINSGDVYCGPLYWRYVPREFVIDGDKLLENGVQVGQISPTNLHFQLVKGDKVRDVNLDLVNDQIQYTELKSDPEGVYLTVKVLLERTP